MTERTIVHLMRHGEVHNPTGVLYGRLPEFLLSELGHEMAQAAADALAGRDVTYLVASPLERAQQTAAPTAANFDLPVVTDDRVIEADNTFEGSKFGVGSGSLRHPSVWWRLRNPLRPGWGEPYSHIAARMCAADIDALEAARGHEAVIVSHQLPVWIACGSFEQKSFVHEPRRRQCTTRPGAA
jgi:broad specificity phosphatase PhoE